MVGTLVWTSCERGAEQNLRYLELWSYPDGTLNLVAISEGAEGCEHAFPVCVEQLQGILEGHTMHLRCEHLDLLLERSDDRVCAHCKSESRSWTHCVAVSEFADIVEDLLLVTPFVS